LPARRRLQDATHVALLKTPIIGACDPMVASSRIDIVGGLSGSYILRMPPDFCAAAGRANAIAVTAAMAVASLSQLRIGFAPF
jgi:hypothetical protein